MLSDCNSTSRNIPDKIRIPLLLEVGFQCPMPPKECGSGLNKTELQIHHIEPWSLCKTHNPQNMIALCSSCHYRTHKYKKLKDYVINLKRNISKSAISDDILELQKENVLSNLNREGHLEELFGMLTSVTNYLEDYHCGSVLIPRLYYHRIRALRKIGTDKAKNRAQKILKKLEEKHSSSLYPEKEIIILNARGSFLFNDLYFSQAYNDLYQCKERLQEIDLSNRRYIKSQLDFRLAIINWFMGRTSSDIDILDQCITYYNNIKIDKLLLEAVIKQTNVSTEWRNEVNQLYDEINQSSSISVLGYENHTIAELFSMASEIERKRGNRDRANKYKVLYLYCFRIKGTASHSKVYNFHSRNMKYYS